MTVPNLPEINTFTKRDKNEQSKLGKSPSVYSTEKNGDNNNSIS